MGFPTLLRRGAVLPILLAILWVVPTAWGQPLPAPAVPPAAPAADPAAPAPEAAAPDLTERLWQGTWDALKGQSIVLGGGYTQGTLKFPQFRGDLGSQPQITDNGRLSLLLQYETPEKYFLEYPLQSGRAAFGYNFVFNYGQMAVNRQLQTNAFQGEDVGTAVNGDYVVASPFVFLRMGPLYPDRAVFWKFGFGVGAGAVRLSGNVRAFNGTLGEGKEKVDSNGAVPALFTTATWELDIERWLVLFQSLFLSGTAAKDRFTYEIYSLSVGYRARF